MKKQIVIVLALLMSASLIDARTNVSRGAVDSDAVLAQAALLDDYAQLSLDELKAGKGEEAWNIIGQLQDAMYSNDSSIDPEIAREIMAKIENYKQAENAKVAASRSKQIKDN